MRHRFDPNPIQKVKSKRGENEEQDDEKHFLDLAQSACIMRVR
jgi:hypothetical protein